MQDAELQALVEQLVSVVVRLDQRDEHLEARVAAIIEAHSQQALQTLSAQAGNAVRSGLEAPLAEGQQRIRSVTTEADQTTRTLQVARHDLLTVLRNVWIGAMVALAFSIIALLGTYEMIFGHYQAQFDALKAQVTYLDAVNRSDVVPCGEGRLCARIDEQAPRLGDKKQYRMIELR